MMVEDLLEEVMAEFGQGYEMEPQEVVRDFLENTSELTPGEQAELLGEFLEYQRNSSREGGAGSSRGNFLGDFSRGLQQGLGAFQTGAQLVAGFTSLFGGRNRRAQRAAQVIGRIGQTAGQIGQYAGQFNTLFQGLRGRQTPSLPSAPGARAPGGATPGAGRPAIAGQGRNNLAMAGMFFSSPQFQQLIRASGIFGGSAPQSVEVELPSGDSVSIPPAAILNTAASLLQNSIVELNALTPEDAPEVPDYLVGEDGEFLVDPSDPQQRAALVLHYLRLAGEAERERYSDYQEEMDGSDIFALEAGFDEW